MRAPRTTLGRRGSASGSSGGVVARNKPSVVKRTSFLLARGRTKIKRCNGPVSTAESDRTMMRSARARGSWGCGYVYSDPARASRTICTSPEDRPREEVDCVGSRAIVLGVQQLRVCACNGPLPPRLLVPEMEGFPVWAPAAAPSHRLPEIPPIGPCRLVRSVLAFMKVFWLDAVQYRAICFGRWDGRHGRESARSRVFALIALCPSWRFCRTTHYPFPGSIHRPPHLRSISPGDRSHSLLANSPSWPCQVT